MRGRGHRRGRHDRQQPGPWPERQRHRRRHRGRRPERRLQVPQPARRADLSDYFDKDDFYGRFARGEFGRVDAVLHQGACSDTMEHNGRFMLDTNYRCSQRPARSLPGAGHAPAVRLVGRRRTAAARTFREEPEFERPLNVYGYSKLLFDNVRALAGCRRQRAGRRLPLLQRLRPARAAQGAHGVGGLPPIQRVRRSTGR